MRLRAKIRAVTTTQQPVLDRDRPEILEEARWWIRVTESRTRRSTSRMTMTARANVQADADQVAGMVNEMTMPATAMAGSVNVTKMVNDALSAQAPAGPGSLPFFSDGFHGLPQVRGRCRRAEAPRRRRSQRHSLSRLCSQRLEQKRWMQLATSRLCLGVS